jgi:hypothetical protein
MKTLVFMTAFIFLTGVSGLVAQEVKINPIPSFDFLLAEGSAVFGEIRTDGDASREKRQMEVVVSSTSHGLQTVFATVMIIKENKEVVLGPFLVNDGEKLTVGIDDGKWGVVVRSSYEVLVNVWTD